MLGADADNILSVGESPMWRRRVVERVTIWDANGLYPQIEVEATATYERPGSEVKWRLILTVHPIVASKSRRFQNWKKWAWLFLVSASAGIAGVEIRIKMSRTELSNSVEYCAISM